MALLPTIGPSYPGDKWVVNAGLISASGAAASGSVPGYIVITTLPTGAVVHYVEMQVATAVTGITTMTGQLITADTGTQNNPTTYGAATTLTTTATDVQTGGFVFESMLVKRDLILKLVMSTGSEVATSVTAGLVNVWVFYSIRGN